MMAKEGPTWTRKLLAAVGSSSTSPAACSQLLRNGAEEHHRPLTPSLVAA